MPPPADHVRRQCLALGMDADEPLAVLLIGLAEGQDETKRLIEDAASKLAAAECGISPDREKAYLDRLAQSADRIMRIHAVHYLRAGSLRNVLVAAGALFCVAAACLGGGYWWGHSAAGRDQLLATCQSGQVITAAGGRRYCAVWLDPAQPAKPR